MKFDIKVYRFSNNFCKLHHRAHIFNYKLMRHLINAFAVGEYLFVIKLKEIEINNYKLIKSYNN